VRALELSTSGNGASCGGAASSALWITTRGIQPRLETVISYFGTTVPSLVRMHEHNAIMTNIVQVERDVNIISSGAAASRTMRSCAESGNPFISGHIWVCSIRSIRR
jgi:hypothetical protein